MISAFVGRLSLKRKGERIHLCRRHLAKRTRDTAGLGESAVVSYVLVFDSLEEQNRWYAALKWLRKNRPEETIAGRVLAFMGDHLPLEDVG